MPVRPRHWFTPLAAAVMLVLGLVVASPATASKPTVKPGDGSPVRSESVHASGHATVNMRDLSARQSRRASGPPVYRIPGATEGTESEGGEPLGRAAPATLVNDPPGSPSVSSPLPAKSYIGLPDESPVGTTTFFIPPDTNGAVGTTQYVEQLNTNYAVLNKSTGAVLTKVSMESFWASTGATGLFDPRTRFDPYNNRWILSAVSNSNSAASSVLVGVSQTADATGSFNLFRYDTDSTNTNWSDFPTLGFNKNWVAIGLNMFSNSSNAGAGGKLLVVDYPAARANAAVATLFTSASIFTLNPAVTYSPTEGALYAVEHLSSAGGTYVMLTVTGTSSAPSAAFGATKTNPLGGWTQPGGDILPQQCLSGCPAGPPYRGIDSGDAQLRGNVVFRNGSLYYSQTIGIGPAGPGSTPVLRTGAQWVKLDTAGNFVDGGRIIDPTATNANGGKWYAYSSIAVNDQSDVLVGFSQFGSAQFAAAGYAYHDHTDAAGTMRDPVIMKAGEDYYLKTFGGTRNRWGDYSNVNVDPVDDWTFWTVQEYAGTRVTPGGLGVNDSRWATWVSAVQNPVCTITGTSGNDTLKGTTGPDVICGLDGNDTLTGLGGDDVLVGGIGNDVLVGGRGNDVLNGGPGTDKAMFFDSKVSAGMTIDLNAAGTSSPVLGADTFAYSGLVNTIENVEGTPFNDTITGNALNNVLIGRDGVDTISGGDGNDLISGGGGADTLSGGNNDDRIQPGMGDDSVDGGLGINTLDYSDLKGSGSGQTVDLPTHFSDGFAGTDTLTVSFVNVYGSARDDGLYADLSGVASSVNGFGGDDSIFTSDGDGLDTVYGGTDAFNDDCIVDLGDTVIACP